MYRGTIIIETEKGQKKFSQCFNTERECNEWLSAKSEQARRLKFKKTSFSIVSFYSM